MSDGYWCKHHRQVAFPKIRAELNVSGAQPRLKDGFHPAPEHHQQIRKAPPSVNNCGSVSASACYTVLCVWDFLIMINIAPRLLWQATGCVGLYNVVCGAEQIASSIAITDIVAELYNKIVIFSSCDWEK